MPANISGSHTSIILAVKFTSSIYDTFHRWIAIIIALSHIIVMISYTHILTSFDSCPVVLHSSMSDDLTNQIKILVFVRRLLQTMKYDNVDGFMKVSG